LVVAIPNNSAVQRNVIGHWIVVSEVKIQVFVPTIVLLPHPYQ
jgi:hypothetical protein